MFCVITEEMRPFLVSFAIARCPILGLAVRTTSSVLNLRRHDSRLISSDARKSWNSIGLYFVQIPPGLRKSGIPDSVLIPAPVKIVVLRAW